MKEIKNNTKTELFERAPVGRALVKMALPVMKRFVKCFFVFIDIFIILEYDLYNKSYFGGK